MRKNIFLFFAIALLMLSQVSALTTNIKSSYGEKETMIIKVGGSIADTIQDEQISFKRNNIFVPLEYDVARVGNSWYIWAIAPSQKGNYTFFINNVETIKAGGTVQKENYQSYFEVTNNLTGYNVNPGFIITNKAFSIQAEVLDEQDKDISAGFSGEQGIILQPGINNLDFSISKIKNTGLYTLQVGKYQVPVYITIPGSIPIEEGAVSNVSLNETQQNSTANESVEVNETIYPLEISPEYIERLLYSDSQGASYSFVLYNPNNFEYKDIKIKYNKELFDITPEDEFDLKANSSYSFNITLGKYSGKEIKENITLNYTDFSIYVPFSIRYTENISDVVEFYGELKNSSVSNTTRKTTSLCGEMAGHVCADSSTCSGQTLESKDGLCCLGICKDKESEGGFSWIVVIIAILVIGGAWYFYVKYKGVGTAPLNVTKVAEGP